MCYLSSPQKGVLGAQENATRRVMVQAVVMVMTRTARELAAPHAHRASRRCLMSSSYGWSLNRSSPAQNRSAIVYAPSVMEDILAYLPDHSTRSPGRRPADTRSASPSCCFQTVFEPYLAAHLAYLFCDAVTMKINLM